MYLNAQSLAVVLTVLRKGLTLDPTILEVIRVKPWILTTIKRQGSRPPVVDRPIKETNRSEKQEREPHLTWSPQVRNKEVHRDLPSPVILQLPNMVSGFKCEKDVCITVSLTHHCPGFSISCEVVRQVTKTVKFLPGRRIPSLAGTKFSLSLSPARDSWGAFQCLLDHYFSSLMDKERITQHFPVSLLLPERLNRLSWNSLCYLLLASYLEKSPASAS